MVRLLAPSDLYFAMRPIFHASRSLGLAPFYAYLDADHHKFRLSRVATLFSTIFLLVVSVWKIFSIKKLLSHSGSSLAEMVFSVSQISFHLRGFVSHTLRLVYRKDVATLLSELSAAERSLSSASARAETYKRMLSLQVVHFTVISVLMLVSHITYVLWADGSAAMIIDIISSTQDFIADLQFVYLAALLQHCFCALNAQLLASPGRARVLARRHAALCRLAHDANAAYSLQLLVSTALVFLEATYLLYVGGTVLLLDESAEVGGALAILPWLLTFVFRLYGVAAACSAATQQVGHTGALVHKLLLTGPGAPALREELQLFSLQLLHRQVQFSACGFFPLDFSLLYSIVGAVTTYLVILIEFQLAFGSTSSASNNF